PGVPRRPVPFGGRAGLPAPARRRQDPGADRHRAGAGGGPRAERAVAGGEKEGGAGPRAPAAGGRGARRPAPPPAGQKGVEGSGARRRNARRRSWRDFGCRAAIPGGGNMLKTDRSPALRYGTALLSVAVVTVIRVMLEPFLGSYSRLLPFALAVMFAAWYGGL